MPPAPHHLQPHAAVAERVLLPGDPGRALRLAQWLLERPMMLNHHRGLWGYTGVAADGEPLTIQSTGTGGPSAAIVVQELVELGAARLIRVGTCRGLADRAALGDVLVVGEAIGEDGTSRALGAPGSQRPDPALSGALMAAAGPGSRAVTVVSTDVFYEADPAAGARRREAGAVAVDLETAAVLAVSGARGVSAACVLGVTRIGDLGSSHSIDPAGLADLEQAMGRAAGAALS